MIIVKNQYLYFIYIYLYTIQILVINNYYSTLRK